MVETVSLEARNQSLSVFASSSEDPTLEITLRLDLLQPPCTQGFGDRLEPLIAPRTLH